VVICPLEMATSGVGVWPSFNPVHTPGLLFVNLHIKLARADKKKATNQVVALKNIKCLEKLFAE